MLPVVKSLDKRLAPAITTDARDITVEYLTLITDTKKPNSFGGCIRLLSFKNF
jgi:hypothetical protein